LDISPAFSSKHNDVAGSHIASSIVAATVFNRFTQTELQRFVRSLQAELGSSVSARLSTVR
jgi:hypothetical protein